MKEANVELDATGMSCPMPLLHTKRALQAMQPGQTLRVTATDAGSERDIARFAQQAGHRMLQSESREGVFVYLLEKG